VVSYDVTAGLAVEDERNHAVHHEKMRKGNYVTITLLYDKLFGTLG
jgi:sterol desaturase/sphingolipid hydroxylase (fatty acid hydroxylase superfamily)